MHKAHKAFFSRLSYSFGNEDWRVERKALNIQPNDRIICVTASGDRPLHLLMDPCAELISVDLNEHQNHLLSLKANAMKHLKFEEYLRFLGATECNRRIEVLKQLLPNLDSASAHFWQQNQKHIRRGVIYQGAVEKLCRRGASIIKLLRGKKVQRLFEFDDLEEQRKFLKKEWNSYIWQKSLRMLFNPLLMRLTLQDPGWFAHLSDNIHPATYISERLNNSLHRGLAKENPFMSLVLRGYVDKENFPPYLTEEGCGVIRQQLDKMQWKNDNFITYLENSPPDSFDCFSVSDISSYMPSQDFARLLRAIHRTARPGARFSIRQFMSDHPLPEDIKPYYHRSSVLEKELEDEECCFVYRFIAGKIKK